MKTVEASFANRVEASAQLENIYISLCAITEQGNVNLAFLATLNRALAEAINLLDENIGIPKTLA